MIETLSHILLAFLPMSAPAATVTASVPPPASPHGLAIGIEAGQPASATVGWFADKLSVDAALGSGTLLGPGFEAHLDVQVIATRLAPNVPLRVGLGGRYYDQHYQAASPDELPQQRWGVRSPVSIALDKPSWQVYAEVAPGVDLHRSASCNLLDGANSVCPHAQSTPAFVDFVVGARFFLSH